MNDDEKKHMLETLRRTAPQTLTGLDVVDICAYFICTFAQDREEAKLFLVAIAVCALSQPSWDQKVPVQ
jgi:hypothetical protein